MLETNLELHTNIIEKINQLAQKAEISKALILNETDLQCLMYKKLSEIELLKELSRTNDGYLTSKIHTEVAFFDENGLLRLRPDITLMMPQNLSITDGINRNLPAKGFHSTDGGVIFELKFDRGKTRISTNTVDTIRKDVNKFRTLLQRYEEGEHSLFCFFILFVKSSMHAEHNHTLQTEIETLFEELPNDKYHFSIKYIGV